MANIFESAEKEFTLNDVKLSPPISFNFRMTDSIGYLSFMDERGNTTTVQVRGKVSLDLETGKMIFSFERVF